MTNCEGTRHGQKHGSHAKVALTFQRKIKKPLCTVGDSAFSLSLCVCCMLGPGSVICSAAAFSHHLLPPVCPRLSWVKCKHSLWIVENYSDATTFLDSPFFFQNPFLSDPWPVWRHRMAAGIPANMVLPQNASTPQSSTSIRIVVNNIFTNAFIFTIVKLVNYIWFYIAIASPFAFCGILLVCKNALFCDKIVSKQSTLCSPD